MLIAEDARNRALSVGLALRLAMTLAPGIEGARLRRKSKTLTLSVHRDFISPEVERRLAALAAALDLSSELREL